MRGIIFVAMAGAILLCPGFALADAQTYCRDFGADIAAMRLTGRAILTGSPSSRPTDEQLSEAAAAATADCLARFASGTKRPAAARPAAAKPRKPASQEAGGDAWKAYCTKKYASFDSIDGTYKANSGKRRPCRMSKK